MTDHIYRSASQADMNSAFQALGAWRYKTTPDGKGTILQDEGPITQGTTKEGQSYFVVVQGTVMVPQRNPSGWTSTQSKDAMGNPVTIWKPNGPIVMAKNAMGGQSPVMQPYDKGYYAVLRWLGDNPPEMPSTVTLIDRNTLNPDFMAGIPAIA